jgi:hypothetical protein
MPAGTTLSDRVAPAGERPKKTPIFVSGASDTRGFLTWERTQCPSSLSAQMKAEKLMIVPGTADGFRATVSALRSLDGSKGVSFHTLSLPDDRQVRLFIKNLGRQMPESVFCEELEALGICVQGVMQLRSRRRDLDASKDRPLTPQIIVTVVRGPGVQKVCSLSELNGLPGALPAARLTYQGSAPPQSSSIMLQLRGQPHGQLPGLQQVERGKSGGCKASAQPTHPDQRCCRPARREQSGHATAMRRAGEPCIWLKPCPRRSCC